MKKVIYRTGVSMHQYKNKNKHKAKNVFACLFASILTFTIIAIPKASATTNYFTAEGSTLVFDDIDPFNPDERLVTVEIKADRAMTIHSVEGYFAPANDDPELMINPFGQIETAFPGMGGICYSVTTGWFNWNTDECDDPYVGDEGLVVQPGDSLFRIIYRVKEGVEVLRRNMPARVNFAIIDDGTETDKRVESSSMDAYVVAGRTIPVLVYKDGNGTLEYPSRIVEGTEIEIKVVPEPGNELTYLELNGQEITDQVKNNTYKIIVMEDNLTFYTFFRRVYQVLEGDGGKFIVGSGDDLSFTIDADLTDFDGTGLIFIDDEPIDLNYDRVVDEENSKIILLNSFLKTLEKGKHTFTAVFSSPEAGSAKAVFYVAEPDDPEEDSSESDEPLIPNTGAMTKKDDNSKSIGSPLILTLIGAIAAVGFLLKKQVKKLKSTK